MKSVLPLMIALTWPCLPASADDRGTSKSKSATPEQFRQWVAKLESSDSKSHEQAARNLLNAGSSAVPHLAQAAHSGMPQARLRALAILKDLCDSNDARTCRLAEAAVRKLAASRNFDVAKRAAFILLRRTRLKTMRRLVDDLRVFEEKGGKRLRLKPVGRHLHRFSDLSRTHQDGTMWAWPEKGRPQAMIEIWTNVGTPDRWGHGFKLTSNALITGETGGDIDWTPEAADIEFRPFSRAGRPADKSDARLKQIMALAGRFSGHEFWRPGRTRYELTLLQKPVHRYSDSQSGLIDGAVFLICHDTNPEIILLIEAVRKDRKTIWQYALARTGSAELVANLDGREVWSVPLASPIFGRPDESYWMFFKRTSELPPP